ncbi:GntR family transcriptional regulator [Tamaricihabitans halophyticus]|uniref:GntR family transcriptional regulator n=1 Tax=Tamaricihabitans halophyticus TaxID=1262583 RepID=A0A4R2QIM8_9PSEU|nr:FadR/GntR family transcriptional regulator [Tamaricihabitans halophyticus]TCP46805.1 GntR family transcriptional regulator [Tamaricihabitans halophyticus]
MSGHAAVDEEDELVSPQVSGARANQLALQEAIKELIVDRGLAPGTLLPTEAELMTELGVSRHPLREAIKALEAIGIVEIRHGYGTYVGSLSLSALQAGLAFRSARSMKGDLREIRNLLEVREVLEAGLVSRVLRSYPELDLERLAAAVVEMESAARSGEYAPDADWRFHETLYQSLGNTLVLDLLRVFWTVFNDLDGELPRGEGTPEVTARWHRDIYEALRARDEHALRAAMDEHFRGIRERVAGSVDP